MLKKILIFLLLFLCSIFFFVNCSQIKKKEKFPDSFPSDKAEQIIKNFSDISQLKETIEFLWFFDGMLEKEFPKIIFEDSGGNPIQIETKEKTLFIFAIGTCSFSLAQINKILNDNWQHPNAKKIFVIFEKGNWESALLEIPKLDYYRKNVLLYRHPLPVPLSSFKGIPFSLIVHNGIIISARAGSETIDFGAWQTKN